MNPSINESRARLMEICISICNAMAHKDIKEYSNMEKNMALTITSAAYFLEHRQSVEEFLEFCSDMYEIAHEIYEKSDKI